MGTKYNHASAYSKSEGELTAHLYQEWSMVVVLEYLKSQIKLTGKTTVQFSSNTVESGDTVVYTFTAEVLEGGAVDVIRKLLKDGGGMRNEFSDLDEAAKIAQEFLEKKHGQR